MFICWKSQQNHKSRWFVPNGLCFAFCSSNLCIHKVWWILELKVFSKRSKLNRNNFWRKLCCHIGWRWHNHSPIMPAWLSSFHWYPHWRIWRTLFLQFQQNYVIPCIYSPVCIWFYFLFLLLLFNCWFQPTEAFMVLETFILLEMCLSIQVVFYVMTQWMMLSKVLNVYTSYQSYNYNHIMFFEPKRCEWWSGGSSWICCFNE